MSLRPTLALLALVSLPLMAAQNDPQPSSKELMKEHQAQIQNDLADVDYKRKRIVEANMNLTDQEGEKFWPIYNTYRTESDKLSKETLKLLLDYAQAYNSGNVSDDQASKLIERVDDLQEDRLELRDKYVKRIAKNVSPKRAMRFLADRDPARRHRHPGDRPSGTAGRVTLFPLRQPRPVLLRGAACQRRKAR